MKPEGKQRREIQTEIRMMDEARGICQYVASNQTLDYAKEVIIARGWKFTNFKKNAPFVDSHRYGSIEHLLGKVIDYKVEGNQLIETVQWAIDVEGHALAHLGWKLTAAQYLKACSVGFYPKRLVTRWDRDPKPYNDALKEIGMESAGEGDRPFVIYVEQEQIELSVCILGCNPEALARGYKDGVLDEEDMVSAGFGGDSEFRFLNEAAGIYDGASPQVRGVINQAMARIFADRPGKTLSQDKAPTTAPTAKTPADADGANERRELDAILAEFKNIIKN